jgi:CRP/FNR family transcriptional regulator, cyclic AMP receptor protein
MALEEPLIATIDRTWFGAGLNLETSAKLAAIAHAYDAPPDTVLLREGDETRELGLVIHGRVALASTVPGRGPISLVTVESGDVFGWSVLVPPFRATSTARAVDRVSVVAFDGARLRAAVRGDTALAAAVYQQLLEAVARRLVATRHQLFDLYRLDAYEPW